MAVVEAATLKDYDAAVGSKTCVFFWAAWHEPSKPGGQMDEVFSELAGLHQGAMTFIKVEAEANPEVSEKLDIATVPTFVLLKGGVVFGKVEGADPPVLAKRVQELANERLADKEAVGDGAGGLEPELRAKLKRLISASPVMLFMKGGAQEPKCKFSRRMVEMLRGAGVDFGSFDILSDEQVRAGLKIYSNWPTFPQLYVKGVLVGGVDDAAKLAEGGDLKAQLAVAAGVDVSKAAAAAADGTKSVQDRCKKLLASAETMVFMKGSPDAPRCGFSRTLVGLLRDEAIEFSSFDILEDQDVRQALKELPRFQVPLRVAVRSEEFPDFRPKITTMTPPAAKRRRSVEHAESTRNINVVKGGLSIMCPADSMGMLIGKGGSGLRGMQEKSGVKVSLQETKSMPEGAKERGVGLSGSLPNVAAVEKIIFEKLNARRVTALAPSPAEEEFEIAYQAAKAAGLPLNTVQENNDPSKVTVVRWVMDNSHCGWLIGKGGSGIQNIEATSGAEVRVATEKSMTKESGERIVYIKGTPFQREKALDMIRSNPKISGRVAGAKEPETAAVHVPSKAIGFILGHRGASIQALTEKTGAQLRVAPSSEITTGSSEHRVDITGGPQQIVAARHALGERIEEWRATNNPSSAPEEIEYSIKIAVPQPLVGHIIGKGGQFVREVLAITSVQVKIQQDTASPTLWGDACCVMLSGTMDNVVKAQQMILERIANISDRLKDMVPNAVTISADQDPDDPVRKLEVNIQLPDGPPPAQAQHNNFQQPPPFGQQQPPAFGFAPPFRQPGPGGPFMPGQQQQQQQFQPQFQQQFQQPPPQQQQQGYRQPQAPSGPPGDNITFTSIRQLNAPGLTAASKQPGGMEMLVDNSVVGSIIGKGGQTIRKISTESGATIQVQGRDDVSPSQRERRVTVTSDEMSALLTAANMICAVLRNNEKLSMAARQGGAPGAGGGPGSNGAAGGGGDRERGAPRGQGPNNGPRGGSGPPPASPSGGATPANFPFQQQQQPVPVQFSPTPAMAAFPPQQGFVAQQPVPGGAPIQQAYPYPQQVQGQGPPQQQQLVQQVPQQQQPPAQAAAGQFAQQQPLQPGQQPPQGQQPGQPGQQPGAVFYQQPAGANGPPQGTPQGVQYAQPQQQPPQQQQAPAQQQQQPHMQQQTPPQQQQQQLPVQQLPLQGQAQPAASGAAVPPTSSPAPVYGWVYDQASGTYTAAPAAATPAPQSSSFPAQPQYSQQQQQQPPQQQQQQR